MKHFRPGAYDRLEKSLHDVRQEQGESPRAVLMISGHWEADTRGIMSGAGKASSATFDRWLNDTLVEVAPEERRRRLLEWSKAPAARAAHPREDHLIPLLVATGAAGKDAGARVYHESDFMGAITASSYRFDAPIVSPAQQVLENAI